MKKGSKANLVAKILCFVAFSILSILALIFIFLNLRMLFAGDFLAYSNPAAGCFNMIFKVIANAFIIAYTVILFVYLLKEETPTTLKYFVYIFTIGFALIALTDCAYFAFNKSSGYVAYLDLVMMVLYILGGVGIIIHYVITYKSKDDEPIEVTENVVEDLEPKINETTENLEK